MCKSEERNKKCYEFNSSPNSPAKNRFINNAECVFEETLDGGYLSLRLVKKQNM